MNIFTTYIDLQCIDVHYSDSISDLEVEVLLGRNSDNYTYVSDAHNTTSWLDHIMCSHNMHQHISSLEILKKLAKSDHLPLSIHLDIYKDIPKCQIKDYNVCFSKQIHIPIDALVCKDTSRTDTVHTSAIDSWCGFY